MEGIITLISNPHLESDGSKLAKMVRNSRPATNDNKNIGKAGNPAQLTLICVTNNVYQQNIYVLRERAVEIIMKTNLIVVHDLIYKYFAGCFKVYCEAGFIWLFIV